MKPTTHTQPDSKEGLHTQGTWWIDRASNDSELIITAGVGATAIASLYCQPMDEETKANAELIVKAVNNFERMKEALEWLIEGVDEGETIKGAKVMHAIAEATTILSQLNR